MAFHVALLEDSRSKALVLERGFDCPGIQIGNITIFSFH